MIEPIFLNMYGGVKSWYTSRDDAISSGLVVFYNAEFWIVE